MRDFQQNVRNWMMDCFGPKIASDRKERNYRFLEEALELVQANGCSIEDAHALVEYVFNRPEGEANQELGGVMVTLAALCNTANLMIEEAAWKEMARVWEKKDEIRAKQASKKIKSGPLP